MKNYQDFLSENFHFLMVKFSVYLNRRVFVMVASDFWYRRLTDICNGLLSHVE